MKTTRLKAGVTVDVQTKTERFDYVLKKQDVEDIKKGEWDEVGFVILSYSKPKYYLFKRIKKALLKYI